MASARTRFLGAYRRHPIASGVATAVVAAAFAFALYWFAPWNLFVDKRVAEAPPAASPAVATSPDAPSPDAPSPAASDVGRRLVARGSFRSLEHESSGTALVLELTDGSRYLRFENLETSNGPDLRVWLTDRPLSEDWHVWDDGRYVDLGALKGNVGDQNYRIPRGLDLAPFRTAVVWCRRFSVGFAVAPLERAG